MAEHGPPKNGVIFFFVVLSVGTLVSLKPAFDAYYDGMFRGAVSDRLEMADDLAQLHTAQANWDGELSDIDEAIEQLESRPAAVRPAAPADMNLDALRGWNQLPQQVPAHVTAALSPEPEPVLEEVLPVEGEPEDEPTPDDVPDPEE